jgi:hypothetical protein
MSLEAEELELGRISGVCVARIIEKKWQEII